MLVLLFLNSLYSSPRGNRNVQKMHAVTKIKKITIFSYGLAKITNLKCVCCGFAKMQILHDFSLPCFANFTNVFDLCYVNYNTSAKRRCGFKRKSYENREDTSLKKWLKINFTSLKIFICFKLLV